jgi:hypothetical protein
MIGKMAVSDLQIEEIRHEAYGNCLKFSNRVATVMVSLDYGPRIIHFSLGDGPNLMFFNREPGYMKCGPEFDRAFYPGAYWNIRGGNRLWIAPHSFPYAFYPDNDPVGYEMLDGAVRFSPPPRTQIGAQISTEVALDPFEAAVTVHHSVCNISAESKKWAAWSITSVDAGGLEIIPMTRRQTGVLPNRRIVLWPYTDIQDTRFMLKNQYAILRHDSAQSAPLKMGFNNEDGWACYIVKNMCFTIRFSYVEGAEYPDFGASYETFEDNRMVEMETLSPLRVLQPGESVTLTETWTLTEFLARDYPEGQDEIEKFADLMCRYSGRYPEKGKK